MKKIAYIIIACLVVQAATISFAFADWVTLGNNSGGHTSSLTPRTASEVIKKWTQGNFTAAQWKSVSYPVIIGNFIYVAMSSNIYKINKNTSEVSATKVLGRPAAGGVAGSYPASIGYAAFLSYGDGKIYVPLEKGDIQAFDANTLEPVWYASYGNNTAYKKVLVRISGVAGDKVMDAAQAATEYPGVTVDDAKWTDVVIGGSTKKVKISSVEYKAETQVLFDNGRIYTGTYFYLNNNETYGTFFSINTLDENTDDKYEDKTFAWEYEEPSGTLRGYYWAGVASAGNNILVAGDAGKILSFDKITGLPIGGVNGSVSITSGAGSFARAGMTYAENGVGGGSIYITTKAGKLWKVLYDEATGAFGTTSSAGLSCGAGASAPALSGNKLYVLSGGINAGGCLDVFDKNTLSKKSTIDIGGYSQSFPLVCDGYNGKTYLYVMLNEIKNDSVIVIEDAPGFAMPKYRTLYTPGGSQSLNSIIADGDGTLCFFDGSGRLNALSSKRLDYDPVDDIHSIVFDSAGGSAVKPIETVNGRACGALGAPLRTGYTFAGWYLDRAYKTKLTADFVVTPGHPVTITAYAKWVPVTTTLKFNVNGGKALASSKATKAVTYDAPAGSLPSPVTGKKGYYFAGWFTSKSGGTRLTSSIVINFTAPQTVYAHWGKKYTVKFDAIGGKVSPKNKKYIRGALYGSLPTPTRSGYKFDGWFTKKNGGSKISATSMVNIKKNTTLYAHWKKK